MISWRTKLAMRPREVAEVLSISERQVHRLIRDERLETRVVGRARLVLVASVLSFIGSSSQYSPSCQSLGPAASSVLDRFRRSRSRSPR